MTDSRSYPTFEEWAKDLRFGPYVEDEVIAQVRKIAETAFEAGRQVGRLEALTHPDDDLKGKST